MFLVDTNVLLYATNEAATGHAACRRLLDRWRVQQTAWFTTWGVLYEFLRVASHPRIPGRPWPIVKATEFVRVLLESPSLVVLSPTSRHLSILAQTVREVPGLSGSLLHDVHTVVLMREHGIRRIVTFDADFRRFPFLEVVDPLRTDWPDGVRERPRPATRGSAKPRSRRSRKQRA